MLSAKSPEWKKPSDIMKIHRKKKVVPKGYLGKSPGMTQSPASPQPLPSSPSQSHRKKRKNPFGFSPRKRANMEASSQVDRSVESGATDGVLLDVLNRKDRQLSVPVSETDTKALSPPAVPVPTLPCSPEELITPSRAQRPEKKKVQEKPQYDSFPYDWSLKMKSRFVSSCPFSWCTSLKTADEAKGMERFIQHSHSPVDLGGKPPAQSQAAKADLHKCCLYWVHPNIPWLKLFPRMVTDNKIGKTSTVLQDKEVQEAMMSDWTESFTSAFHLLRAGFCPYLYLCCHQFTVAFFAAKTRSPSSPMEAIITPTSRGFREALKAEGIEFDLPLQPKSEPDVSPKSSRQTKSPRQTSAPDVEAGEEPVLDAEAGRDEDMEDDDLEQTDEGAATWLETLGLDKKRYRSLDPNKVKLQRDGFRLIDNRPESTVYVKGTQTQALFNFLLNCRSCVANTGIQAGIPPTLLSSSAFKGAALKTLKVKQSILRGQSSEEQAYSLEVTGPILSSTYSGLNQLFTLTQRDYTATYSVHDPTAPFNMCTEEENGDSGTDGTGAIVHLGKEAIRELTFCDNRFTLNKY